VTGPFTSPKVRVGRKLFTSCAILILALVPAALIATGCEKRGDDRTLLRFWVMGREGEVVPELVREFERENPDIRVQVQQIPWSAAHEKLLTAYVGGSAPDIAQLGNTWVAEFSALKALEPLTTWLAGSAGVDPASFFSGIWDTNVIDGVSYGIPWYVDTRVLFYRKDVLAEAGYEKMPATWSEWRSAMEAVKRLVGSENFAIFLPANEPTQAIILGLQAGSTLLAEKATRGAFSEPEFQRAFRFYIDIFQDDLAPPVANTEVANLYQEFARGYFAMYITGPWNLGEFRRQLPPEMQEKWGTAPLPGPDGGDTGVSLAGGASLVVFRESRHKEEAWRLLEFLSQPEQQLRFYELTGDLPAVCEAWEDSTLLADPNIRIFGEQLQRVVATPKIPEWEQIAVRIQVRAEEVIRGVTTQEKALAELDQEVDRILEKRRWLVEREGRREPLRMGGSE